MRLPWQRNVPHWQTDMTGMEEMREKYQEGKKGALASFLPAYYYSPWMEGRGREEQRYLLEAEELELADGIRGIGNYTFYGCGSLRKLKFTDTLKEIGGGSFTGCSRLRELEVLMEKGAPTCIRDVVAETFHEVYVTLQFRGDKGQARLVFPEYYEEGVENTPARILETHFHGSGYRYRQCFTDKKIDFKRYDSLFGVAKVYEKSEILIPMCMGRLLYPFELGDYAREDYLAYLRAHLKEAGEYALKGSEWNQNLNFLMKEAAGNREDGDILLNLAMESGRTEAVSLLMEEKRKRFGLAAKSFDF